MKLYRASVSDTVEEPSFWAEDIAHARRYTKMPGFGGPNLYETTVVASSDQILDLRTSPWITVHMKFGIDRADYVEPPWLDHEILGALAPVFRDHDYEWVRFSDSFGVTWMHVGQSRLDSAAHMLHAQNELQELGGEYPL